MNNYTNITDKALAIHLKEIRNKPTTDTTIEKELVKMASNGDLRAQSQLVTNHLGLVVHIAKKYEKNNHQLSDLIAAGNLGLVIASQKIVYKYGFQFAWFATPYIKREILEYIRKNESLIRIQSKNKDERYENSYVSLDKNIDGNDSTTFLYTTIEDKNIDGPGIDLDPDPIIHIVEYYLKKLKPAKRAVLELYFGLNGAEEPLNTKEIAKITDLTHQRVSQIIKESLKEMKNEHN